MFSKNTKKTLFITAVIFIAGTTMAFAHGKWDNKGGMGYGPGDSPRGGGYASDLSDEQKAAVDAARDQFRAETEPLRTQLRDKRTALRDAINAETPNVEQIMALQKEISALEGEFDLIAVQHRLAMRELLPDDYAGRGFGKHGGRGFDRYGCRP